MMSAWQQAALMQGLAGQGMPQAAMVPQMSGGKGGGGGKGKPNPAQDWGVPGFQEALQEALSPHVDLEPQWTLEEMCNRVGTKIFKAAKKFASDERATNRGTATQAKALIEEFVDSAMGAVSAGCYDKPWFSKANFTAPLLAITLHTLQGAKIFSRTLAPMVEKFVEESVFKYFEEERIQKAMWDACELSGVKETHIKKASQHLQKAYDDAHFKAPYGTTQGETPAISLLQDFVKGWMSDFVGRAWDIIENGTNTGGPGKEAGVLFCTVLFQNLTDANMACLPNDITSLIETPPPSPWPFVAQCAETVFNELEATGPATKRFKGGKGGCKGGCKGDMMMMAQMMGFT
jgi:hypothetical protein